MTLYQFNILNEPEKIATIALKGNLIGERTENIYLITLFQVEAFYVEIWQIELTRDFHKVRSFLNTEQLKQYLEEIDVQEFTNN